MEKTSDYKVYRLQLFVAGEEANSIRARKNISKICEKYLKDNYELEVIDILKDFKKALNNGVLVTPMLIVAAPPPEATVVGSLSDTEKVLNALKLAALDEKL